MNYKVKITRFDEYEVSVDTTIWNEEALKHWSKYMFEVDSVKDLIEPFTLDFQNHEIVKNGVVIERIDSTEYDVEIINNKYMKREIKYRGWDLVDEKMLPVESIYFRENLISLNEGDNSLTDSSDMIDIMQFADKVDEFGNDIYCGDLISDRPKGKYICEVIYDNTLKAFATRNIKTNHVAYLSEFTYAYIVGNIYQNSNLLTTSTHEA